VRLARPVVVGLLGLLLTSCALIREPGGRYYADDGPPGGSGPNPASVPNPVPRVEALSAIGNAPYTALGTRYYPVATAKGYQERGLASWYGRMFHGRHTSSGEVYDMYAMTAAHRTLPLPTYVKVKALDTGQEIIARVNDRGPFMGGRIIDLSFMAAKKLGIVARGTAKVEVTAITPAESSGVRSKSPVNRIFLQAGSFRLPGNAETLQRRLVAAGLRSTEVIEARVNKTLYYRVRVGPVREVSDIDGQVEKIRQLTGVTPRVERK